MNESVVVGEFKPSCELDSRVKDKLNVAAWHIDGQIHAMLLTELLDVIKHGATVVVFDHDELVAAGLLTELVKSCDDVGVGLQFDPGFDVLVVACLRDHEVSPKVFMKDDEGRIVEHFGHLNSCTEISLDKRWFQKIGQSFGLLPTAALPSRIL